MKYKIDFEYGIAQLWSRNPLKDPVEKFAELANQCFGIRKSMGDLTLKETVNENLPEPWFFMLEAEFVLHHKGDLSDLPGLDPRASSIMKFVNTIDEGDLIVWDKKGNKIKDEYDDPEEAIARNSERIKKEAGIKENKK